MLLVEYSLLDKFQVINEGTGANKKLKIRGRFQKCDEQNNNGRVYPRKILESQVKVIQDKISERSLVGALDHPPNDAIHLSQASHLITSLKVDKAGDVIGEAEILSTPNGKIVEALLGDGVKIGISSRGLGSVSEGRMGEAVVNEDFKLITFDLVSDPSTKGAFPDLCESMIENSQKAQKIISKHKKERVFLTLLESMIEGTNEADDMGWTSPTSTGVKAPKTDALGGTTRQRPAKGRARTPEENKATLAKYAQIKADAAVPPKPKDVDINNQEKRLRKGGEEDHRGLQMPKAKPLAKKPESTTRPQHGASDYVNDGEVRKPKRRPAGHKVGPNDGYGPKIPANAKTVTDIAPMPAKEVDQSPKAKPLPKKRQESETTPPRGSAEETYNRLFNIIRNRFK
tara:strand:+ start:11259 stop:12458 length:1200 start_codon:yes stop_codon:yes gene_type:complete